MGARVDEVRARFEAELRLAGVEDEFVAAKAAGDVSPELRERLRSARREFRAGRDGSATPTPETIETTSEVSSLGGGS